MLCLYRFGDRRLSIYSTNRTKLRPQRSSTRAQLTPNPKVSIKMSGIIFIGSSFLVLLSAVSITAAGTSMVPFNKISSTVSLSPARAPEVDPIDAAAHLQLLGESLSLIGHRLQETEVNFHIYSMGYLYMYVLYIYEFTVLFRPY